MYTLLSSFKSLSMPLVFVHFVPKKVCKSLPLAFPFEGYKHIRSEHVNFNSAEGYIKQKRERENERMKKRRQNDKEVSDKLLFQCKMHHVGFVSETESFESIALVFIHTHKHTDTHTQALNKTVVKSSFHGML